MPDNMKQSRFTDLSFSDGIVVATQCLWQYSFHYITLKNEVL